ncbi:hypothetical protein [Methylotenera versatilis]|uniref:Uncharacterized protein n=1 Tax=Methylotenera versatilis (strain 301) TaxID=666681 RepID=D7DJQ0_METV0|nr:hypothetical protein [Methylotenera versatilis]ADI28410.1 hypothetical protein M301_0022 [Methylotenera versatilis 301]
MSTPDGNFRETEYLGLGFLAVKSSVLLSRILQGQDINDDDKYILKRAQDFLTEVSSGARLVNSGNSTNANAIESVRKLSYSVEPIKLMHEQIRATEVEGVFNDMASAIESAIASPNPADLKENELNRATEFFKVLHLSLLNIVENKQKRFGSTFELNFARI